MIKFAQSFEIGELARFGPTDLKNNLKSFIDLKDVADTAFNDGKFAGILSVAKKLKNKGMSLTFIIETTGLTKEEIDRL